MIQFFEKLHPYKNLVKNFTSLSVLQASNYLFPIIVLPYVVRVLGPDKFGLVQFAAAFNAYFLILCEYGFALTGTRMVSLNRNDPAKLSEIFSSIIFIKLILFLFSFLLLISITFSFYRFADEWQIYLISSGMVFGTILFPLWFFQGIEQMKYITIINIAIRIISTVSIFIFIQTSSDYILLAVINSSTFILIGITGLLIAIIKFKIRIHIPAIYKLIKMLKEGWNIFLSSVSINLYTTSNTFILGLFTNNTIVGYYSAADKIRIALQGILSTLSQSVFPFVSNLAKKSYNDFINFNKRLLKLAGGSGLIISAVLFIFAFDITDIILGNAFVEAGYLLRIISVLPFLISLSNVTGIQTMLPLGYDKSFNRIITSAALMHIILLLILIPGFKASGVALTVVITESLVTLLFFIFLKIKKINLFK